MLIIFIYIYILMAAHDDNKLADAFRRFKDYKPPTRSQLIYSDIRRKSQSFLKRSLKKISMVEKEKLKNA